MPTIGTVHHVALTVTDVDRSAEFYNRVFGTSTMLADTDDIGPIALLSAPSLLIGLRRHAATTEKDAFDHARIGLDHVGLQVDSREELERWREHLDAEGVRHSGIVEDPYGAHLNLKDPDGIALELYFPPQQ